MIVNNLKEVAVFAVNNNLEVITRDFFAEGIHQINFRKEYEGICVLKSRDGMHRVCVKSKDGKGKDVLEILFATTLRIAKDRTNIGAFPLDDGISPGCHSVLYLGQAASYYDGIISNISDGTTPGIYKMIWFCYDGMVFSSTILHGKGALYNHEYVCNITDSQSIEQIKSAIADRFGLKNTAEALLKLSLGDKTVGELLPQYRLIVKFVKMQRQKKLDAEK